MQKRGKKRRGLTVAVAELMDLPSEAAAGETRLTLTGDRRLYVENHRGIREYGSERILLEGKGCGVLVEGRELSLCAMNRKELMVRGEITAISFTAPRGRRL